jgi:hypothetical protein
MATQATTSQDLPNGPVAAALLAGGIGAAVLGILTTAVEASPAFGKALAWSSAVGPLTGKSILAVIAFFGSWALLHFVWFRGRNVNFARVAVIAFILLAIGLLFTFPPIFDLFAPKA